MHIPKGIRYTTAFGLALGMTAACGDGEVQAPGGSSSEGSTGPSTTLGSGATGGAARGVSGGAGGTGGNGDPGTAGSAGAIGPEAGTGGVSSTVGAAGEAGASADACAGLPVCETPGWSCDDDTLVHCAESVDGCLVEMRTACAPRVCLATETARCENAGKSCATARQVRESTVIRGSSFADDFDDGQDFVGEGCPGLGPGATDAVFQVEVPGGSTIVVTEVGEHYRGNTSIDAHFAILSACNDDAACLTSADAPDTRGVSYTAEQDETVYVWVGAEDGDQGAYEIRIEYATELGSIGLGDTLSVTEDTALAQGDLRTYHFELSEAGVLHGTLNAASDGDLDLGYVYDESGALVFDALTYGSENFAAPLQPGSYRAVVFVYFAADGYSLEFSLDPLTELGDFDTGDSFMGDYSRITDGRSEFYRFRLLSTATIEWNATHPDPAGQASLQLNAYFDTLLLAQAPAVEGLASLVGSALPGTYLLQALATPGEGEISTHQLELSFEEF